MNTAQVPRDHWKRPLIVPQHDVKAVPYTRISKYAELLSDGYALSVWQQNKVAQGLAENRYLLRAVETAIEEDDFKALSAVCAVARDKAGANDKAAYGTRLHEYTDHLDSGRDFEWPHINEPEYADLMAYADTMDAAGIKVVASERFVVNERFRAAGTFDRIVEIDGIKYIADLKTGRLDISPIKFAMQFSLYANGWYYRCEHEPTHDELGQVSKVGCELNPAMHDWQHPGADSQSALLIHLPAEAGTCDLYWVNLDAGLDACDLAEEVKAARKKKVLTPFVLDAPPF